MVCGGRGRWGWQHCGVDGLAAGALGLVVGGTHCVAFLLQNELEAGLAGEAVSDVAIEAAGVTFSAPSTLNKPPCRTAIHTGSTEQIEAADALLAGLATAS